jgi:hypothetical protein
MSVAVRTPRIAVVLPVWNGEAYLAEAVGSVLAQTFEDFELIAVDDGSTDHTPQVLAGFSDRRLRVITLPEHRGLVAALNAGIRESASELIARMDADDICRPRRFERQVAFLDAHPQVALCGAWMILYGGETDILRPPEAPHQVRARLFFGKALDHPSIMMRRDFLERNGLAYDDEFRHVEDFDFFIRAAELGDLANVPEVLLYSRAHSGAVSVIHREEQVRTQGQLLLRQLRLLMPNVTTDDATLHLEICDGRLPASRLGRAEQWLRRLDRVNVETKRYDAGAFRAELRKKWYELCLRAISERPRALLSYWSSPLASIQDVSLRDHASLVGRHPVINRVFKPLQRPARLVFGRGSDNLRIIRERLLRGVERGVIDAAAIEQAVPSRFRKEVVASIAPHLKPSDNVDFFARMGTWSGWHKGLPRQIANLEDLFPPNFAVLDFYGKHIQHPGGERVLEYACGLGVMLVYLNRLGFTAYGYDNWSQLAQSSAESFLSAHGLPGRLLSAADLSTHRFTILSCIGIHWTWLSEIEHVLEQPTLKYVLVDRQYGPNSIPGFRKVVEYKHLLTVHQRNTA